MFLKNMYNATLMVSKSEFTKSLRTTYVQIAYYITGSDPTQPYEEMNRASSEGGRA